MVCIMHGKPKQIKSIGAAEAPSIHHDIRAQGR